MRQLWRQIGDTFILLRACVRDARDIDWREALRQCFIMGNRSFLFIAVVMGFTGGILVIQAAFQVRRQIGDLSIVGPAFLQLMVREFGPTIVAMMVAARYGAGVSAELAAMRVSEQVDALRMSGAEAAPALVAPRVIAGLVGMLPLVIYGTLIAYVSGGFAAQAAFGVSWHSYASTGMVDAVDVVVGLAKSVAFGVAVPLVASQAGLAARGGSAGVGRATTRAVIASSLTVLALDFFLGAVGLALDGWGQG